MKFIKEVSPKGLLVPAAAMRLAGFDEGETLELHALTGTAVLLKRRMTAMELIRASDGLFQLSTDLTFHLAKACGFCEGCGACPIGEDDTIRLPAFLRAMAGIPADAKLCADTDSEEGAVTITQADYDHDLRDVPKRVRDAFQDAGVCLGHLEEHLMEEDTVYGD